MQTIDSLVHHILVDGSNRSASGTRRKSWESCPHWPPDLFAVVGTLAEVSGFYAEPPFTSPWQNGYVFSPGFRQEVCTLGLQWWQTGQPPALVSTLWRQLLSYGARAIFDRNPESVAWKIAAMKLLSIADEACAGIGFVPDVDTPPDSPPVTVLRGHVELLEGRVPDLLFLPYSLCKMARPDVVCVQPKTNTPRLGCALRSLTHNLALLPPAGVVQTSWKFAHADSDSEDRLNLLLVPFPYVIGDGDFGATEHRAGEGFAFFEVTQQWMRNGRASVAPSDITNFLVELIGEAQRTAPVHGVVLPELALPKKCADQVATDLAKKTELQLFITGTLGRDSSGPRNFATTYRIFSGEVLQPISQSKHHRWCLDGVQIGRYGFQSSLDPRDNWWEQIEIGARSCAFEVLRHGACFAVLVCEDLARFDPVFPAIAAVGPNLVIALLMDGPQTKERWSARYATALADDPGSSVLTLTSLGMVRRSTNGTRTTRMNSIGLWKDAHGGYCQLELADTDQALLISLELDSTTQFTLDGRADGRGAKAFKLSGQRGIELDQVPAWLDLTPDPAGLSSSALKMG